MGSILYSHPLSVKSGKAQSIVTLPANSTGYSFPVSSSSVPYIFRVRAFNALGNSDWSNEANARAPKAARDLVALPIGPGSAKLTWTDAASTENGFRVYRRALANPGYSYELVGSVEANSSTYKDYGLTPATAYAYRVASFNQEAESQLSNVAELTTYPANSGPTDNPVTGCGLDHAWTDEIAWVNVKNIQNYGGTNWHEKFEYARDEAAAQGGGVVYFPAGVYEFSDDLVTTNGVVIRGEVASIGDAKEESFGSTLLTHFEFPQYVPSFTGSGTPNSTAFKNIETANANGDSNIGIVSVDVNRAGIHFNATNANGCTNRNILVFGIRNNNVAEPDPSIPQSYQNAWQRWSYRFACNIKVLAFENVLVANNRINDNLTDSYEQPGYITRAESGTATMLLAGNQAVFNYGNHYGIDVNRNKPGGYANAGTPITEPSLFRKGIVVCDNYVYHTMRIAITAAGDGLQIRNNVIRDQDGKVAWLNPTGQRLVGNSNTLENRAIDWSGNNVVVDGNDYEVYRHKLKDTFFGSIDGEGILIQECCGGSLVNGVTITNNHGPTPTYIGLYKVKDINDAYIAGNTVEDASLGIYVTANTNNANFKADNVVVQENTVAGPIFINASVPNSTVNYIVDNVAVGDNRKIRISCAANVVVDNNQGFTLEPCF